MSKELCPNEFEVFRWYIVEHYLNVLGLDSAGGKLDFKTGTHLMWMLGEIEGGAGRAKKLGEQAANRWLGFVQGALFQAGVCTIDELRADTTAAMEKAAIYNHIEVSPSGGSTTVWQVKVYGAVIASEFMEDEEDDHEVRRQVTRILYDGKWQRMPSKTFEHPVRAKDVPNIATADIEGVSIRRTGVTVTKPVLVGTEPRATCVMEYEARACVEEAKALLKAATQPSHRYVP